MPAGRPPGDDEPQAETTVAAAWADAATHIRQLDAFRAAGLVDDQEYADQKARILASL